MKAALEQWEIMLRVGAYEFFGDTSLCRPAEAVGNDVVNADKLRAASLWQRALLPMLNTNISNNYPEEPSAYVEPVHTIHKARAIGLLEAGRIDDALLEIAQAQAAQVSDIDLVEQILPKLIAAGRSKDADRIFSA